jgi:small conductance mechanosensitive channel
MEELTQKTYDFILTYGMSILAAALIFIIGKIVVRFLSNIVGKILEKAKVDKTLCSFVSHLVSMGGMLFVVIAAINKLGVETTSLVAVLGAAGLAVGLALQGSLSNFAAGVILIVLKPFKVGDCVEIGDEVGIVQELQIFNTIINTLDNRRIIYPNSQITSDKIINLSVVQKRRIDLVFGISYSDSIKDAKEALESVVSSDDRILKEPKPTIAVSELGDSSVNLVCRPWVAPKDYWDVYFDVTEKGKLALEAAGITIPFPQRDVHMYQEK